MSIEKTLVMAEHLLTMPKDGYRYALVKGELRKMPLNGARHGSTVALILSFVGDFVRNHKLGKTFAPGTGFLLYRAPDTVRAPDVAFVSRERLPEGEIPATFLEMAPDLVVEVVSPNDTAAEVQEKVEEWLRAGTRMVWVVYPNIHSVTVFRSLSEVQVLGESESLNSAPVLPGFSCQVNQLF
ncbi:MAG: hypothetical protein HW403_1348 [Dehalococcoidia bacterium]|nr:hypothetical protein [Dehalococcoidia bacterium]